MGSLFVSLLPLIIGSAVVPLQIVLFILLLKNPNRGLLKAAAFFAGMTTTRLLQGIFFGPILAGSGESAGQTGGKSPVVATLLLVLGVLLLVAAYRKWRKEVDPDDPPPKWKSGLDKLTPPKAFGLGLVLLLIGPKFWVFTLSALAGIGEAQLGQPSAALAYLLFILLAQSLLLLALLLRLIAPVPAQDLLTRVSVWLERNNRPVVITISFVFGLYFLYQGASALIG